MGGTDVPYVVKLYADPYSDTIMLGVQDNAADLNMVAWDGSGWGSVTTLDASTGFTYDVVPPEQMDRHGVGKVLYLGDPQALAELEAQDLRDDVHAAQAKLARAERALQAGDVAGADHDLDASEETLLGQIAARFG